MNYEEFLAELASSADDEYRDFIMKGIPTERPILGVRVPRLREIAREISDVPDFLSHAPISREEVSVRGFVIASLPYDEMKKCLPDFVALIDNWENCDTFCASLRRAVLSRKTAARAAKVTARAASSYVTSSDRRADFLETLDKFLTSSREFGVRFALVCLLDFYVDADYLPVIFDRVLRVSNRDEYYIKMAVAWLLATCYIKFPEPTESFLMSADLPDWTFNKTISKICDSYRVDKDAKARLRALRRATSN
ncbi:DNA alkylation repair protein [Candidatus Saccharibacteria bacterium]|nr:DNA alkylation repair protein [Candidatus Saccharibacteria bacterium]